MIQCRNLLQLINVTISQGYDLNCWIYTNLEAWESSPSSANFFFIDEDEVFDMPDDQIYETDDGGYLPLALRDLDLYPWLESATLVGVIDNASIPRDPSQEEIERFAIAANHYREYDDFYDHPAATA